MGFDDQSDRPILQPRKKSTKVNFWIAGAVVVFLLFGAVYLFYTAGHERQTQNEVQKGLQSKP